MRALLVLVLLAGTALAKPTIAVAPIEGDSENKVADVIAEVAGEDAKVIGPEKTAKAMDKLGLSGELERKDLSKLRAKLEADALITGKIERDGKTRKLDLSVTAMGRKPQKFTLTYRNADSDRFKSELSDELRKRTSAGGGEPEGDEPEEDEPKKKKLSRNDDDDDDDDKKKKKKKKKKKRGDDDDEEEDEEGSGRHPVTQVALRVNAGASFGRRTLTNDSTATNKPPRVGTAAPGVRVEAEVYPGAFETLKGAAAGIGVFGLYEKQLAVKINVPLEAKDSTISQSHMIVGARYRFAISKATLAIGVGYARRQYVADRSFLADPTQLDMPDVSYTAVAPGVIARFPITPTIGAFVGGNALLPMTAGPIQKSTSYGAANLIAFEFEGGLDAAFGENYGLHIGADFSQIGLKFSAKPGSQAAIRGVSKATDRTYSLFVGFMVLY